MGFDFADFPKQFLLRADRSARHRRRGARRLRRMADPRGARGSARPDRGGGRDARRDPDRLGLRRGAAARRGGAAAAGAEGADFETDALPDLWGRFVCLWRDGGRAFFRLDAGGLLPAVFRPERGMIASTPTLIDALEPLAPRAEVAALFDFPRAARVPALRPDGVRGRHAASAEPSAGSRGLDGGTGLARAGDPRRAASDGGGGQGAGSGRRGPGARPRGGRSRGRTGAALSQRRAGFAHGSGGGARLPRPDDLRDDGQRERHGPPCRGAGSRRRRACRWSSRRSCRPRARRWRTGSGARETRSTIR